jgi:aspartate carbamoyltransferase catalytic subunit
MKNRSLVSIDDISTEEILKILDMAEKFEKQPVRKLLEGKVIATLFFEPSTRTRLSFESAINRLGGKIVGFSDASSSSVAKGETLHDTIKMVSSYSDLIVIRHPIEGSARFASEIASVPVINAGDGANQHPTQTILDLYSIRKTQGKLDKLNIFMVGDLKYGRTVHSLMMAMSRWNATFNFISPEELRMPDEFKLYLDNMGLKYYEHTDFTDIISKADIIYMTRVQKERFSDPIEYEKVKNVYVLRNSMLKNTKPNMRILHPLPRVNEIHTDVDSNPKAYYFEQALNGVFTRQAILCTLLGIKLERAKS